MALLSCENVALGYDFRVIRSGVSFSVNPGDYLCIVGENGCGKSTLMRTILGLQPPVEGKIIMGEGLCAEEIGYLPQQSDAQKDFPASVREIVRSGFLGRCGLRPFYNREEKRLAAQAMERMEISHLEKRCYRELSGGQKQRVLLARAFCAARRLLFLDEPVSGLDPKMTREMYRLIETLNREDGLAVVMISHDIAEAVRYASHILHLGEKTFFGTVLEYKKSGAGRAFSAEKQAVKDDKGEER